VSDGPFAGEWGEVLAQSIERLRKQVGKPFTEVFETIDGSTRRTLAFLRAAILVLLPCLLVGCTGSVAPGSSPATYTIGGTVVNLAGASGGLVLQDNGGDNLLVNANGTFTFPTPIASGGAFNVTVQTQPSNPVQTCAVTNGSGTATANVTSVLVNCGQGEWAWMSGARVIDQGGIYGNKGMPAATNVPGARSSDMSWIDPSGNLWLFGGFGLDSASTAADMNDLWKYTIGIGQWTWMNGYNFAGQKGAYGTQSTPAPGNIPGARESAASWIDTSGNLWLFGGFGLDSAGTSGQLNDLWKYTISNGQWAWMSGSNLVNQSGTYGTQGTPAPGNVPGALILPAGWTDTSGNLWLFGGVSNDYYNDLWMYAP
jgi:hypothetical protein